MTVAQSRFEFRTFARGLGIVERGFRGLAATDGIRESSETYLVSRASNTNNTKIRDDQMDIKVLLSESRGLEQWSPRLKQAFPLKAPVLDTEIFPAFEVTTPELGRDEYDLEQFLSELITIHTDLQAVNIFKRRFAFTINGCIAELGDIYINGAKVHTASLESVDVEAVLEARKLVGLNDYDNINYLSAIKRVIGMEEGSIPW